MILVFSSMSLNNMHISLCLDIWFRALISNLEGKAVALLFTSSNHRSFLSFQSLICFHHTFGRLVIEVNIIRPALFRAESSSYLGSLFLSCSIFGFLGVRTVHCYWHMCLLIHSQTLLVFWISPQLVCCIS